MTKSLTKRTRSLSLSRPLLLPFTILPLNNDDTQNNHVHTILRVHMHKNGARCTSKRCRVHAARSHGTRNHAQPRPRRPIDLRMML